MYIFVQGFVWSLILSSALLIPMPILIQNTSFLLRELPFDGVMAHILLPQFFRVSLSHFLNAFCFFFLCFLAISLLASLILTWLFFWLLLCSAFLTAAAAAADSYYDSFMERSLAHIRTNDECLARPRVFAVAEKRKENANERQLK